LCFGGYFLNLFFLQYLKCGSLFREIYRNSGRRKRQKPSSMIRVSFRTNEHCCPYYYNQYSTSLPGSFWNNKMSVIPFVFRVVSKRQFIICFFFIGSRTENWNRWSKFTNMIFSLSIYSDLFPLFPWRILNFPGRYYLLDKSELYGCNM
jgi:hypothetical protein